MNSINVALSNYERNLSSKGRLRNFYIKVARNFLEFSDGRRDKEAVLEFLESFRRRGYRENSLRTIFAIVRALYKRNDWDWPFARAEGPSPSEEEIEAPALDPSVIVEMIQAAKKNILSPLEAAYLALSTTYGLRRVEMMELKSQDINLKDRTIHIMTAKHGRERTHLIPEQIIPYLSKYSFKDHLSEYKMFILFIAIEYKIGLEHIPRVGWHSIRRTLNTLLLDQLPQNIVMSFLRWKQRTSSFMPYRYSAIRFVGRGGIATKVVGEFKEVDQKVFSVHPFLSSWR